MQQNKMISVKPGRFKLIYVNKFSPGFDQQHNVGNSLSIAVK